MASGTASVGSTWRQNRLRVALLVFTLALPAIAAADDNATVYIWRDANGVIRFSGPR